jgi:actin-like ATPase involved in cell morphogenesis
MHRSRPATGKLAGTGAALSVELGFKPCYVRLVNETQLATSEWVEGMADARAVVTDDSGAGTTDVLVKSSGGITPTSTGFLIGTEATLNTTNDVIYYVAW